MGRQAKPWQRAGRKGWWATIDGRQVMLGETHREAMAEFHRRMASKASAPATLGRLTVQELVDLWFAAVSPRIRPQTARRYQEIMQTFIAHCGKVPGRNLRPLHITGWLDAHPDWHSGTRRLALTTAKTAMRWAAREGWLDRDPLALIKAPPSTVRQPAEWSDADRLVDGIRTDAFRPILAFLLSTGVRPGEARTLEASRIDFGASTAEVEGKSGRRVVTLSGATLGLLARLVKLHPIGPVFLNSRGEPWTAQALRGQFRRSRKRAKVGQIVPYHTRGIWASRAIAAGVDSAVVAKMLGHADLNKLARHYFTPDTETLRSAAELASAGRGKDHPGLERGKEPDS